MRSNKQNFTRNIIEIEEMGHEKHLPGIGFKDTWMDSWNPSGGGEKEREKERKKGEEIGEKRSDKYINLLIEDAEEHLQICVFCVCNVSGRLSNGRQISRVKKIRKGHKFYKIEEINNTFASYKRFTLK